jgi:hypothetical protein
MLCCSIDVGRDSSVGIASSHELDGPGIESRWGGEIFRTCPYRPWGPPSLLYYWYRVFPGGKERPWRDTDPSPLLVPLSRKVRAIPLLPLWAVRPVQSLSDCTRVHFTVRPVQSLSDCTRVYFTVRPVQSLSDCTRVHFTVCPVQSLSACTTVHFTVRPVQSLSDCTRVHFTVRPVQSLSACTRVHFTFTVVLTAKTLIYQRAKNEYSRLS